MRLPVFVADPVSWGEGLETDAGCVKGGRGGVAPPPSAMLPAHTRMRGVGMHDAKPQQPDFSACKVSAAELSVNVSQLIGSRKESASL